MARHGKARYGSSKQNDHETVSKQAVSTSKLLSLSVTSGIMIKILL